VGNLITTVRLRLAWTALAVAVGCGGPRLTAIGDKWFVDPAPPGKPAPHLYRQPDGTRVVVDRQIEAYRLYANRCLIYEAPRADGRFLFVVWGGLTPVAFRTSVGPSRWRLDTDGPRRFETVVDPDGRRLLAMEWINFGDPCYVAQLQPRFNDKWPSATTTPLVTDRINVVQTTVDVDGEDTVGNSTLSDAAHEGQVVLVDELLRAGADPNSANHAGISVLTSAVVSRNLDVARKIVAAGARVNAQDGRGETALMWAVRYRNLEMAKLLIDAGAKTTIRDDIGRTAAVWVPDGSTEELRKLRALVDAAPGGGK